MHLSQDKNLFSKKLFSALFLLLILFVPAGAFADINFSSEPNNTSAINIPLLLNTILTIVWWFFLAIVVVAFVVIGVLFLLAQGDPTKLQEARRAFYWALAGVLIGLLAFSILFLIAGAFGFSLSGTQNNTGGGFNIGGGADDNNPPPGGDGDNNPPPGGDGNPPPGGATGKCCTLGTCSDVTQSQCQGQWFSGTSCAQDSLCFLNPI